MNKKLILRPIMTNEMIDASSYALANERLVMGESVLNFEEEFARYIGTDHAVSVLSGMDALILAIIAFDVKRTAKAVTTERTSLCIRAEASSTWSASNSG